MFKTAALSLSLLLAGAAIVNAGPAADVMSKHLYAGTLERGAQELAALPEDAERRAAQGMLAFFAAVEKLGQGLHRHGLETHPGGMMMQLPVLRMPVPPNPSPEPITYGKWRAILETLKDDLAAADAMLAEGAKSDVSLPLDLMRIRLDLDKDGSAGDAESVGGILAAITQAPQDTPQPKLEFAFDKADVIWLRGYIHFLTAFLQTGLSLDFEEAFLKTGHAWFPNAGLPMSAELKQPAMGMGFADNSIGDLIAFVHLMSWKVEDRERLKDARMRLAAMAALSRESWAAARAETDNDREWLPNAKQTAAFSGLPVDDAAIGGWLAVMGEFEDVLEGRKLMTHWRFQRGFNFKRWLEESEKIDPVLLVAGPDAVPFLEDGPVSGQADWNRLTGAFRGSFLNYALWFN